MTFKLGALVIRSLVIMKMIPRLLTKSWSAEWSEGCHERPPPGPGVRYKCHIQIWRYFEHLNIVIRWDLPHLSWNSYIWEGRGHWTLTRSGDDKMRKSLSGISWCLETCILVIKWLLAIIRIPINFLHPAYLDWSEHLHFCNTRNSIKCRAGSIF